MLAIIDSAEVACSERLRQRSMGCFMPGVCRIGWDSVMHTHVLLWPFGFRGSVLKLCWLLISWSMFSFHDADEEWHGSRDLRSSNGSSSLDGREELAWWFVTWNNGMQVGETSQEKFKVLPCRVKIQGLVLIGCAWQWPCWWHCFVTEDFFQSENLRSMIERRCRLCVVSFLETSLLEKLDFWCCLDGVSTAATRNWSL
jgi:hypothetical protein